MKVKQEENGFVNVSLTKLEVLELAQDLIKMALTDERVNVELIEGTGVMIPPPPVTRTVNIEGTNGYRLVFFNLVHPEKPAAVPKTDSEFPWAPDYMAYVLRNKWKATATCWSEATGEVRDMCVTARHLMHIGEDSAVQFYNIRDPGRWNEVGIDFVVAQYRDMTEAQRLTFCNKHKEWLLEWEAQLPQKAE